MPSGRYGKRSKPVRSAKAALTRFGSVLRGTIAPLQTPLMAVPLQDSPFRAHAAPGRDSRPFRAPASPDPAQGVLGRRNVLLAPKSEKQSSLQSSFFIVHQDYVQFRINLL